MTFWAFMLLTDMVIPVMMIGFGKYFLERGPKKINMIFGYRTNMSMKNQETWEFAHKYCGKIWYRGGCILLPVSIIVLGFVRQEPENVVNTVGKLVCIMQMIPLVGSIIPTELALRKHFDKNGNRKYE